MERMKQYELGGLVLRIPLRYDEQSELYIEDYREYIENSVFTPGGAPVIFAGEDACPLAREAEPGGCPDCGSCAFYHRADPHSWIGICSNVHNQRSLNSPPNEGG